MGITAKLDDYGKPAWITVMVLGFIVFWPIGLAILAYILWSGRLGNWAQGGKHDMFKARGRWHGLCGNGKRPESSGNSAFDEYRADTLRRLEEEESEFHAFLDRLRQAKDKAEFDQFMADRRPRPQGPVAEAQA
jgi:hypothetical protein